ncbi:ATP synthase F1 subunit epsilon [Patescibacteria group bacterium]|nr:ATP synthase F1 subunit epsilon [Patescibacteria group bacterium]
MSFHFRIVTPERVLSEEDVDSVSLPGVEGEITVLTHHVAYVGLLQPGIVQVRRVGVREEDALAISGGFANVDEGGNLLTILVETVERGMELDEATISKAKERAQQVMQNAARQDDASFAAAAAALQRELARARVLSKFHNRRTAGLPIVEQGSIRKDENAS